MISDTNYFEFYVAFIDIFYEISQIKYNMAWWSF